MNIIPRKTIFLDRDGTINLSASEHEYITRPEDLIILRGAAEGIRMLNKNGFRVCIVTNQRGIARGIFSEEQLREVHNYLRNQLERRGARVDQIYYCAHEAGTCRCRKPQTGLFLQAEKDEPVDKMNSFIIGDSESDIIAGRRYGIKTIYIGADNRFHADCYAENLSEAAQKIIAEQLFNK